MKPLAALATLLLALQPQAGLARAAGKPPGAALVERFIAVLPDREALDSAGEAIDPAELDRLSGLNPGKEAQLSAILRRNAACTAPEIVAGSLRMFRTIARNLGEAKVRRLIQFYEGPDYRAFAELTPRVEGNPAPSAKDSAALAKLMADYPLEALNEQLGRAQEVFTADQAFMGAAIRCATEQRDSLEAAGLRAN
jgi:hypothetical protein